MTKFIWRRIKTLWVFSATKAKKILKEVGSWFWKTNSQILCEVYLCRYAKYARNKASFLVMIINRFSPQTNRSHREKKMVARSNRTTKDNLCILIKEKNSSPNHWCQHLGETACKKQQQQQQTFTEKLPKCRMKWFSESLGEKESKSHKLVDKSQLHQIQGRRMVKNLKKIDEPDIEGERCLTLASCRPRTAV